MTAREDVLARIASALGRPGVTPARAGGDQAPGHTGGGQAALGDPIPRGYRTGTETPGGHLLDLLAGRLADYGSAMRRTTPGELAATVAAALAERGAHRIIVPPGLNLAGLPDGTGLIVDDGHSHEALDGFDGVITGAAVAIAETGTIVLDGSADQGRRALSLIPDYHLCILRAGQVVALVPEALERLRPDRPLTWISGPSATSDIELDRVEGVHGPRTLEVILVEETR